MFTFDNPEFTGFFELLSTHKSNAPRAWFAGTFVVSFLFQFALYMLILLSGEPTEPFNPNPRFGFAFLGVSFFFSQYVVTRRFGKDLKKPH